MRFLVGDQLLYASLTNTLNIIDLLLITDLEVRPTNGSRKRRKT
jgi:hypothetical protein